MNEFKNVKCAGALVFNINESNDIDFLLVRHTLDKYNRWGIPKGHVETGESILEAAVRETWEETGVVPRLLYNLPIVKTRPKNNMQKSVYLYLSRPLNYNIRFNTNEIAEVKWFNINNIPEVYLYQQPVLVYAKTLINKYL